MIFMLGSGVRHNRFWRLLFLIFSFLLFIKSEKSIKQKHYSKVPWLRVVISWRATDYFRPLDKKTFFLVISRLSPLETLVSEITPFCFFDRVSVRFLVVHLFIYSIRLFLPQLANSDFLEQSLTHTLHVFLSRHPHKKSVAITTTK